MIVLTQVKRYLSLILNPGEDHPGLNHCHKQEDRQTFCNP